MSQVQAGIRCDVDPMWADVGYLQVLGLQFNVPGLRVQGSGIAIVGLGFSLSAANKFMLLRWPTVAATASVITAGMLMLLPWLLVRMHVLSVRRVSHTTSKSQQQQYHFDRHRHFNMTFSVVI